VAKLTELQREEEKKKKKEIEKLHVEKRKAEERLAATNQ